MKTKAQKRSEAQARADRRAAMTEDERTAHDQQAKAAYDKARQ